MNKIATPAILFACLMVARLLPYSTTFSPFLALVALAGSLYATRWTPILVMATVAAGDLILGLHSSMLFTWPLFAAFAWLGTYSPDRSSYAWNTAAGVLTFYVVTNLAMCLTGMYPMTFTGASEALVAGLPFLKGQMTGLFVLVAVYFVAEAGITVHEQDPQSC